MNTIKNGKLFLSNNQILHFTINHNDKMAGMISLSTNPVFNTLCNIKANNEQSICYHCFSRRMIKRFKNLSNTLKENLDILTTRILTDEEIPFINSYLFRFEAFGDLNNTTQFINYYNIAKANPHCNFALWTKNPFIIIKAFKELGVTKENRIKNLVIVLSSPLMNRQLKQNPFWFIDKIFTVYDTDTKAEINCGALQCATCQKCYHRDNGITIINEKLK